MSRLYMYAHIYICVYIYTRILWAFQENMESHEYVFRCLFVKPAVEVVVSTNLAEASVRGLSASLALEQVLEGLQSKYQ